MDSYLITLIAKAYRARRPGPTRRGHPTAGGIGARWWMGAIATAARCVIGLSLILTTGCQATPIQLRDDREAAFVEEFKRTFPELANDRDVLQSALMGYRAGRAGGSGGPVTCMAVPLGDGFSSIDCL